jgi:hypothetical protein
MDTYKSKQRLEHDCEAGGGMQGQVLEKYACMRYLLAPSIRALLKYLYTFNMYTGYWEIGLPEHHSIRYAAESSRLKIGTGYHRSIIRKFCPANLGVEIEDSDEPSV